MGDACRDPLQCAGRDLSSRRECDLRYVFGGQRLTYRYQPRSPRIGRRSRLKSPPNHSYDSSWSPGYGTALLRVLFPLRSIFVFFVMLLLRVFDNLILLIVHWYYYASCPGIVHDIPLLYCTHGDFRTSLAVVAANCSLGVRIYRRYAALLHLPRVMISESSSPACAAAVAAPIR